jgi:hypothetical protein
MVNATADDVLAYLIPPKRPDAKYREWKAARAPNQEDIELARKALEYAQTDLRARNDLNDYLYNLSVACSQGTVTSKLAGITASLIAHYVKEVERRTLNEFMAKKLAASTYAGTVGKHHIFLGCKVLQVIQIDSDFGTSLLHKMVDSEGHALTWFSHKDSLGVGAEVNLVATIKKHEEYKGTKQTVITRAVVLDEAGLKANQERLAKEAAKAAREAALTPEERATKKAKNAAAAAKRAATQEENEKWTTWCRCGFLKKDCRGNEGHGGYGSWDHQDIDYDNKADARELPDYLAFVAAAITNQGDEQRWTRGTTST